MKRFICVREITNKDLATLKKIDRSFIKEFDLPKQDIYEESEGYQPEGLLSYLEDTRKTLTASYNRLVSKYLGNDCTGIHCGNLGYWQ
jgi:hypothetical protein